MKFSIYVPEQLWYQACAVSGRELPVSQLIQEALRCYIEQRRSRPRPPLAQGEDDIFAA